MGKMTSSALLLSIIIIIIFLIAEQSTICCQAKNNVTFDCVPREKRALLRFKASMFDPSDRLSTWNTNYDCCRWRGVECDKTTGHVTGLDLRNEECDYTSNNKLQSKTIDSSSLLELKYLSYLDLSCNDFQQSSIPASLGSMKQLKHLNLSFARISGIVPHQLGNLSSLHTLDLSSTGLIDDLMWASNLSSRLTDDLMWASNLSSLEYLDLSHVNLNQTKDLIKVLSMLPSLVELHLSHSSLDNKNLPHTCLNSTILANVQYLDLSYNAFEGEFPCFLQNKTSLSYLDLSFNQYNSTDPHFITSKNLSYLNLGDNSLNYKSDWISDLLWDKCHLKSLILTGNQFYGDMSGVFKNTSGCWSHNLEILNLWGNNLDGHLPEEIGELKQLKELDLSANNFYGPIPSSIGNLTTLRVLDLTVNKLSGEVPITLGQLSNLEKISIYDNSLEGTLSEAHFANLSKLYYLRIESFDRFPIWNNNMLEFRVGHAWVPPFQLEYLQMGSTKIGGQFPQWIQTQKALRWLELSNCSISGTLPKWLSSLMNLGYLVLSHNHIEGPIPEFPSGVYYLDLSENMINGSIPDSLCQMKGLRSFYISKNHLSGSLPDCWGNLAFLEDVSLSSNQLSGPIPNSFGLASGLNFLRLDNNSLTGQIPSTLKNCTMLMEFDVGDNMLFGKLPQWIGNHLLSLQVLRLRNNKLYGPIPSTYCQLSQLQILDFGSNNLMGNIPHCLGNLSGMVKGGSEFPYDTTITSIFFFLSFFTQFERPYSLNEMVKGAMREYTRKYHYLVNLDLSSNQLFGEIPSGLTTLTALIGLNLSHNHLGGKIPMNIGDMKSLESFDLSNNNLFGTIPKSLSGVTSLGYLNLSNNNLSGQIPRGSQLQTFLLSYEGNLGLCGAPLLKKCHNNTETPPKLGNHDDDGELTDTFYLCAFIITGLATGFWGYFGVMLFKRSWRLALFRHMDTLIHKIMMGWHYIRATFSRCNF